MSIPKIPADGFTVIHGPFGFSLGVQQADLANVGSSGTQSVKFETVEEIRVSPLVAKQLLHALSVNIGKYEDMFGEIKDLPPPPPEKTN